MIRVQSEPLIRHSNDTRQSIPRLELLTDLLLNSTLLQAISYNHAQLFHDRYQRIIVLLECNLTRLRDG